MNKTKMLALASLAAALCVIVMALGSLVEILDLSLAILAGLIVAIMAQEYGDRWGWAVFAVAGLLSLLLPEKSAGIAFLLFCGWYPIVQKKLHLLKPFLCRLVKEVLFNAVLALDLFLSVKILGAESRWILAATVVLGNVCFVFYDLLLDRFLLWYIIKLRDRLGFHKRRK